MIEPYSGAISRILVGVEDLLVRTAVPIAICISFGVIALAILLAVRPDAAPQRRAWKRYAAAAAGYAGAALLVATAWAILRAVLPVEQQAVEWRESAEATANPAPDAPPLNQFAPAAAALVERTYTRTLALPPQFLQRIGADGVAVLAPYLSNPSAEDVLRLVDTFRRSGQDVVFTRQVTRLDEEPIPFADSYVRVRFHRLSGRAYDVDFEGRYKFGNLTDHPIIARFQFPLPYGSTIRDLNVTVGGQAVSEPDSSGSYEWKSELHAGEQREAVVRYRAVGARTWAYDLGSARRRVQQFRLEAEQAGRVGFLRGSLQPSSTGSTLRWDLANVVTAQRAAIAFPPDTTARDCYLQALGALPIALLLFAAAVLALGSRIRLRSGPAPLVAAIALFALGLGAAPIVAGYIGPAAALIAAPVAGSLLAALALGWRCVVVGIPVALLPAAFLSPEHTGLIVLPLAILAVAGAAFAPRLTRRAA